ncbi:MAG: hypothetical protein AB1772_06790 [Candidatus Zixiibacteriota bacterium]
MTSTRLTVLPIALFLSLTIAGHSVTALAGETQSDYKTESGLRLGRLQAGAEEPQVFHTAHGRGNIRLAVANNGTFGTYGQVIPDPFTGDPLPSCEYPRGTDIVFLYVAAVWVGAIVNGDTLVSTGDEDFYRTQEFWPDLPELGGRFRYGSIDINSKFYSPSVAAYSEEDILAEYYDTQTASGLVGRDPTDQRGHIPLGIKVSQRSMAWSYEYADDFILFDYQIQNIGQDRLRRVYIGLWVDGDTWHTSRNTPEGWEDDITGFYPFHPAPEGCGFIDTVNIAWHADNDGDGMPRENPSQWDYRSTLGVVGSRVVRTPSDSLAYSFNWWITNYSDPALDFGPRMRGTDSRPFRDLGPRMGTPEGDRNKYYVMSQPEFDYDLMWTAKDHSFDGWLPPPPEARSYARGFDTRYLLSFGPFDIEPGQALPLTFVWVGGEDFHQAPEDMFAFFDPENPEAYYDRLNFSNLALNARWASWVYDNPGVDTDGDGYRGKARVCVPDGATDTTAEDSLWYEGDGVPDFRGAGPPPSPRMRVIPSVGQMRVRFNGFYSENTKDVFTNRVDFEGYRVYLSLDDRPSSFSVIRSYDLENYARFVWREQAARSDWLQDEVPYTLDSLRRMYNDPTLDPLRHPRSNPVSYNGEFAYFEKQDFNQSDLTNADGIHKVYPDAPDPGTDSTQWQDDDLVFDYSEPLPKYYEYEYVIENLLPTIPYHVSVTSFDHGSPKSGLKSLETKPENDAIEEYPQPSSGEIIGQNLDAYVVPNPYRIDGGYAESGFENRARDIADPDRARRIHFFNLPPVCKISIYSLDGDLVREIDHDFPSGAPGSQHESWDLITRNSQTVVSGLFYWVVESPERTQIGKVAIIK